MRWLKLKGRRKEPKGETYAVLIVDNFHMDPEKDYTVEV